MKQKTLETKKDRWHCHEKGQWCSDLNINSIIIIILPYFYPEILRVTFYPNHSHNHFGQPAFPLTTTICHQISTARSTEKKLFPSTKKP
jgi:hypothetical protein